MTTKLKMRAPTKILLHNRQMRLHRSLPDAPDTPLRTPLTANILQDGRLQRVHNADRAMKPGEGRSSPYPRRVQRNFYVQHGVRLRWVEQCLLSRHLPTKIICCVNLHLWQGAKPRTPPFFVFCLSLAPFPLFASLLFPSSMARG